MTFKKVWPFSSPVIHTLSRILINNIIISISTKYFLYDCLIILFVVQHINFKEITQSIHFWLQLSLFNLYTNIVKYVHSIQRYLFVLAHNFNTKTISSKCLLNKCSQTRVLINHDNTIFFICELENPNKSLLS